jgi:prepilin-type N-terminal cleavage/methylation domain-containing protein
MTQYRFCRKGFTLVEVIVVAVIVLILSAVAIPMYNGFVKNARQDTVVNLAETAAAAANTLWRKLGPTANISTADLKLYYDSTSYRVSKPSGGCVTVEENPNGKKCSSSSDCIKRSRVYDNEATCSDSAN